MDKRTHNPDDYYDGRIAHELTLSAVFWTDETSVVLLCPCGGYRIRRKADKAMLRSYIRERWEGYSRFMFLGCFTCNKKSPSRCWTPETKQEKEEAQRVLREPNQKLELAMRKKWELEAGVDRLSLRNNLGRRPMWGWTQKSGKLTQSKGTGIDWYYIVPINYHASKDDPFCKRVHQSVS